MSEKVAVYPGSFDPITRGHEDIVRRALLFCDRVIVAVAHRRTQTKSGLFSIPERLDLIRHVFDDEPRVIITDFSGLLVSFARERDVRIIIRGLRAVSDFEYEFQMASMNRCLDHGMETVFLMASDRNHFISSRFVKEIALLGGDISPFVPARIARIVRATFGGQNL